MDSILNNGSFSYLPKDVLKNELILHIVGNKRLDIENHKGIVEYNEDRIRIKSKYGVILFIGRSMLIKEIDPYTITIFGKLTSISYEGDA